MSLEKPTHTAWKKFLPLTLVTSQLIPSSAPLYKLFANITTPENLREEELRILHRNTMLGACDRDKHKGSAYVLKPTNRGDSDTIEKTAKCINWDGKGTGIIAPSLGRYKLLPLRNSAGEQVNIVVLHEPFITKDIYKNPAVKVIPLEYDQNDSTEKLMSSGHPQDSSHDSIFSKDFEINISGKRRNIIFFIPGDNSDNLLRDYKLMLNRRDGDKIQISFIINNGSNLGNGFKSLLGMPHTGTNKYPNSIIKVESTN